MQHQSIQPELMLTELYQAFQPGDLLFGIQAVRSRMIPLLNVKIKNAKPVTPDGYNNKLLHVLCPDSPEPSSVAISSNQKTYLDNLSTVPVKKVRPGSFMTDGEAYAQKTSRKFNMEDRQLRRACKAALLISGVTKHFMLDGLNLLEIFDREYSKNAASSSPTHPIAYDSYTSAEVRFIFRHFDLTNDSVKFYLGGKQVEIAALLTNQVLDKLAGYLRGVGSEHALAILMELRYNAHARVEATPSLETQGMTDGNALVLGVRTGALVPRAPKRMGSKCFASSEEAKKARGKALYSEENLEKGGNGSASPNTVTSEDESIEIPEAVRLKFE